MSCSLCVGLRLRCVGDWGVSEVGVRGWHGVGLSG